MAEQLKRLPTEKEAIEERLALELAGPMEERELTTKSTVGLVDLPEIDTRRPQKLPDTTAILERGLAMEQEAAAKSFMESQQERGAIDEAHQAQFEERGIKMGGRLVARQQLKNVLGQQERVLNDLAFVSGLKDEATINKFKADLGGRLTEIRRELLIKAQKMRKELEERKADAAERRAVIGALGAIAAGVTGGIIAGAGTKVAIDQFSGTGETSEPSQAIPPEEQI